MRKKRVRKRYRQKTPKPRPVSISIVEASERIRWLALNEAHEWVGSVEAATEVTALTLANTLGGVEVRLDPPFEVRAGRLQRLETMGKPTVDELDLIDMWLYDHRYD